MNIILWILFLSIIAYSANYVIQLLIKTREQRGYIAEGFGLLDTQGNQLQSRDEVYEGTVKPKNEHDFLKTAVILKSGVAESNPTQSTYKYLGGLADNLSGKLTVTNQQFNIEGPPTPNHIIMIKPSKLSYLRQKSNLVCLNEENSKKLRRKIGRVQPYVYPKNQPNLETYYERPYYRDSRYPQQPVDVEFIQDPKAFCRKYPSRYPCYQLTRRGYKVN
jgi:hypothetical protein